MQVLQSVQHVPMWEIRGTEEYSDHIIKHLKRAFYETLDNHLADTPGGIILGPVTVSQQTTDDWLFDNGKTTTFSVSAVCDDLPLPPEYRLIGGPADGHIVRTRGEKVWLVPVMPPPPSLSSYADMNKAPPTLIAEYERQGDSSAYFYVGMHKG